MFSPGLGKKKAVHNNKCRSGRGFAQLLVAVRGTSVPLRLCDAADPAAARGCLEPAARRGDSFWPLSASSAEQGGRQPQTAGLHTCRALYYTSKGPVVPTCAPIFSVTRAQLCILNT